MSCTPTPRRAGARADLALLALATAGLLALPLRGATPVAGLVVAVALLVVPGASVLRRTRLADPFAVVALSVVLSGAMEVLSSLAMVWTGAWYPTPLAVALLLLGGASSVVLARSHPVERVAGSVGPRTSLEVTA